MKKTMAVLLAALTVLAVLPLSVLAADPTNLPYITNKAVCFMDYAGSDDLSGTSATSAKKSWGNGKGNGAIAQVASGGTLVVSGKAYVGASTYTLPQTTSPLLITSLYADVNYMNPNPASNPACALKMRGGTVFTVQSSLILDDIIVFQENEQDTFRVVSGGTLVVGAGVVNMSKTDKQVKISVEPGGRLIVGGGNFEIENNGGEIYYDYSYEYKKVADQAAGVIDTGNSELIQVEPGVVFFDYNTGNNANDGKSASQAKKTMKALGEDGVLGVVAGGGTLVVSGRGYFGAEYTIPKLGSLLTITGMYNGVDYRNHDPETNPAGGAIKIISERTLTIHTDVRFENIILFQENKQNTIRVGNGATVTFGEGVECLSKQEYQMKLVVDAGAYVVFEGGNPGFDSISGEGTVLMADEARSPFRISRLYNDNFADVTEDKWFYEYVKTAYAYKLANGTSNTAFSPDAKFTVAQALTAAANIHTVYTGKTVRTAKSGEAWYVPYVDYCVENQIITKTQFADYDRNITRGEMAMVFANILPDSEYAAVRGGSNPDVTSGMACYAAVQKLYCAGIVGGDAGSGNYRPNDEIIRAEACVIFTRIAAPNYRAK